MSEFGNPIHAAGAMTELSDYYLWEDADRGIRIHLNQEAVDRLQLEILKGADAISHGRAELGGILLGRKERVGRQRVTVIEDFEPVRRQYGSGPFYSLSSKDADHFEAVLAQFKSNTNHSLSVVGYYRSHNREGLFLSKDDLNLVNSCFPEEDNIFLLVKTLPSKACTAGFFFWEDGRIQSEFAYNEIPFIPIEIAPPEYSPKLSDEMSAVPRRPLLASTFQVSSDRRRPDNRRLWLTGAAVMTLAFALIAAFEYGGLRGSRQQAPFPRGGSPLRLHVEQDSDRLILAFDRNCQAVLGANRAVLSIRDGDNRKTLILEPSQLHAGTVSYTPGSDSIDVRLELYRDGSQIAVDTAGVHLAHRLVTEAGARPASSTEEARRVEGAAERKATGLPKQADPSSRTTSQPASVANISRPEQNEKSAISTPERSSAQPQLPPTVATSEVVSNGSFKTSVPPDISPSDARLDQLPSILKNTSVSDLNVPAIPVKAQADSNGQGPPPAERSRAGTQPSVAAPTIPPAPQQSKAILYVAPQIIHRVNPTLSQYARSMFTSEIEVEVIVGIDVQGKVTDARIISVKGFRAGSAFITDDVLKAARLFRFRPAQQDGRSVPSTLPIFFRITREGR